MTLRRLPHVLSNERSFKRKKIFIRLRSHWRCAKLVKDATKNFSSDGIKKKHVKRWNRCDEFEED
jgi:hypothetical protein